MPIVQSIKTTFAALAAGAALATAALAADPTFVGTWAGDLGQCKVPQDKAEAPLILTKDRYDQHEAHCTFKKVESTGEGSYQINSICVVEGDNQPYDFSLTVSGDTLTVTDDTGSRDLLQCK